VGLTSPSHPVPVVQEEPIGPGEGPTAGLPQLAAAVRSAARASSSFGLNPFSIAGAGSSLVLSPAARLRFSDSDASSDGGTPAPLAVGDVRGKQSQRARSRSSGRGLRRHAKFPPRAPAASLADAGWACTGFEAGVVAHAPSFRLASVVVHPPRQIVDRLTLTTFGRSPAVVGVVRAWTRAAPCVGAWRANASTASPPTI